MSAVWDSPALVAGVDQRPDAGPPHVAENRTETAPRTPDDVSPFIGGPCADELCCVYRHRFATGPWTCARNHPRYDSA